MTQRFESLVTASRGTRTGGARRLRLVVLGDGVFGSSALPEDGRFVVGRSTKCDLRVVDASLSRRHVAVHVGESVEVEDLGSSNGTRVRGKALRPGERRRIAPHEIVQIGDCILVVQDLRGLARPRSLLPHTYFLARLQEECERVSGLGSRFALVWLRAGRQTPPETVEGVLGAALRPGDVVASYGPGEYEALLFDASVEDAETWSKRVERALGGEGAGVRVRVASYPRDGRDPEALVARACADLRDEKEPDTADRSRLEGTLGSVLELVERLAPSNVSVLLLGETGVGKEVVARLLHQKSKRPGTFVCVNCAAIAESLFEGEVFGHERGAFTGADRARPGLLESADGGTILLDEIGELPVAMQVKLLRVLEERRVQRVGSTRSRPIDVRFVSATNRDLEAEAARGAFRSDLFYRLAGFTLVIPPLRERPHEIEPLARAFLARACESLGRKVAPTISPAALAWLRHHPWPGNVRELRNVIERAVLLAGRVVEVEHVPASQVRSVLPSFAPRSASFEGELQSEIDDLERRRIVETLEGCGGNQTIAAKRLGISRGTLLRRLDRFGLNRPRKRQK